MVNKYFYSAWYYAIPFLWSNYDLPNELFDPPTCAYISFALLTIVYDKYLYADNLLDMKRIYFGSKVKYRKDEQLNVFLSKKIRACILCHFLKYRVSSIIYLG